MHSLFIQNSYSFDGRVHRQRLAPHRLFILLLAVLRQANAHRIATERNAQHSEADGSEARSKLRRLQEDDHRREEKHRIVDQHFAQSVAAFP